MQNFEVGSVITRLGYRVDQTGADQYKRQTKAIRAEAAKPIRAEAGVDVHHTEFRDFDAAVTRARRSADDGSRSMERLADSGARAGVEFGTRGVTASFGVFTGSVGTMAASAAAATPVLGGLAAAGVAVGGSLAAAGAGAGALGVGLAAALGPVAIVGKRVAGRLEEVKKAYELVKEARASGSAADKKRADEALEGLSTQERRAVGAFGRISGAANRAFGPAQERVMGGIVGLLDRMAPVVDRLRPVFTRIGDAMEKSLGRVGDMISSSKFVQSFERWGRSGARMLEPITDGALALLDLFRRVADTALPHVERGIERVADSLGGLKDADVAGFVENAIRHFRDWYGLVKEVAGLITDMFSSSADEGGGIVRTLTDIVRWMRTLGDEAAAVKGAVVSVGRFFVRAFERIRESLQGGNADATSWANSIRDRFEMVTRFGRDLWRSLSRIFGDMGGDLRVIGQAFVRYQAVVASVVNAVARRILPVLRGVIEGIAMQVRGVVKIVAGLLSGDFSRAWEGAKDVVRGSVRMMGSILRGGADVVKSAVSAMVGAAVKQVGRLPNLFASAGRRAGSALIGGLKSLFSGGASIAGDIGGAIRRWINDKTLFGDSIKILGKTIKIPALRTGGRVGPTAGGARAFIAGEGAMDEWVISQEGDRRSNIQWAKEALEHLTGRSVELHRGGKGRKKKPIHHTPAFVVGRTTRRSISRGEAGIKNYDKDLQRLERQYSQQDRIFNLSDEVLLIERDDGSVIVDPNAQKKRSDELTDLIAMRVKIKKKIEDYMAAIRRLVASYRRAIVRLEKAIKAAKGDVHAKDRAKYRNEIEEYEDRILELSNVADDLPLDIQDQDIDIAELRQERDALGEGTRAADPVDPGSGDGATGGDIGGSDGGGATAQATPTEIAAAAIAEFNRFQSGRAELFGSYGSNFVGSRAAAGYFNDPSAQAAGLQYFGAFGGDQGSGGGTIVNQNIYFAGGPADELTFAQRSAHELRAAL